MQISREASEIIQDFFPIEEISACLELETGIEGNWGQTFLILHPSGVWALARASYAEPCRKIRIDHRIPLRIQHRQFEETLTFADESGNTYSMRLYPASIEPARVFVERVEAMRDTFPSPDVKTTSSRNTAAREQPAQTGTRNANVLAPLAKRGSGTPSDAVRQEPIADAADRLDAAGHVMQNFFERMIERIADAPPLPGESTPKTEPPEEAPSPDFLRLVDTGDVFSRLPAKQQQAAEAYMAAWEKRPDPAVALKLAGIYERILQPDAQLLWMERAAEKTPVGAERDAIIDRIVLILEKKGGSTEIVSAWKSRRSTT